MIWLLSLKRYLPLAAGLLAVGALYAGHRVKVNAAFRSGYEARSAEVAADVARANEATAKIEAKHRQQSAQAAASWELSRAQLETQVRDLLSRPQPRIRLCNASPGSGSVRGTASAAAGSDGEPAGSVDAVRVRELDPSAGILFAGECERQRLQLKALQNWILSVSRQ